MAREKIVEIQCGLLQIDTSYFNDDPLRLLIAQEELEEALNRRLTPKEVEEKISQTAQTIVHRMQIKTSLTENS